MIAPDMATMLGYICSQMWRWTQGFLQEILNSATDKHLQLHHRGQRHFHQ